MVIVAVGTPSDINGGADLSHVWAATKWVLNHAEIMAEPPVVVMKSTVTPDHRNANFVTAYIVTESRTSRTQSSYGRAPLLTIGSDPPGWWSVSTRVTTSRR